MGWDRSLSRPIACAPSPPLSLSLPPPPLTVALCFFFVHHRLLIVTSKVKGGSGTMRSWDSALSRSIACTPSPPLLSPSLPPSLPPPPHLLPSLPPRLPLLVDCYFYTLKVDGGVGFKVDGGVGRLDRGAAHRRASSLTLSSLLHPSPA